MANPNLINTTSCEIQHAGYILTSTPATIAGSKTTISNPYQNKSIKVVSCYFANVTAFTQTVSVNTNNPGGIIRFYAIQVAIPARSTLVLATKDSPIHLSEFQCLEAYSTGSDLIHAQVNFEVYDDA